MLRKNLYGLLSCLFLAGCGMIDYHPYDVRISGETNVNAHNMEKIEANCKGKTTIRFAAMGDSQRWYDATEDFVKEINKRDDIDFVIHGGPKYDLPAKMFGVFRHSLREPFVPIFRGFDDEFFVPHSRHTEIRREDIMKVPELTLLSESEESGVYMAMARGGREFFITGHSEYSPYTLNDEYMRDLGKGLPINKPRNYYRNNDPAQGPVVRWRGHANLLFTNWLNYYVYQETPFRREDIKKLGSL